MGTNVGWPSNTSARPWSGLQLCPRVGRAVRRVQPDARRARLARDARVREQARAAALRAVALDSTLAEAHAALGNIQYFIDWNWGAAEQSLRRAIALNANDAVAHRWYSALLTIVGRYPEAIAEAERAERLDPLNPFMVLGTIWASTTARDYRGEPLQPAGGWN